MKKTFLTVAFSIVLIALTVSVVILSVKVHRQQNEIDDLVLLTATDIGINEIRNVEGASVKTTVAVGHMKEKIDNLEPVYEILEILRGSDSESDDYQNNIINFDVDRDGRCCSLDLQRSYGPEIFFDL